MVRTDIGGGAAAFYRETANALRSERNSINTLYMALRGTSLRGLAGDFFEASFRRISGSIDHYCAHLESCSEEFDKITEGGNEIQILSEGLMGLGSGTEGRIAINYDRLSNAVSDLGNLMAIELPHTERELNSAEGHYQDLELVSVTANPAINEIPELFRELLGLRTRIQNLSSETSEWENESYAKLNALSLGIDIQTSLNGEITAAGDFSYLANRLREREIIRELETSQSLGDSIVQSVNQEMLGATGEHLVVSAVQNNATVLGRGADVAFRAKGGFFVGGMVAETVLRIGRGEEPREVVTDVAARGTFVIVGGAIGTAIFPGVGTVVGAIGGDIAYYFWGDTYIGAIQWVADGITGFFSGNNLDYEWPATGHPAGSVMR